MTTIKLQVKITKMIIRKCLFETNWLLDCKMQIQWLVLIKCSPSLIIVTSLFEKSWLLVFVTQNRIKRR